MKKTSIHRFYHMRDVLLEMQRITLAPPNDQVLAKRALERCLEILGEAARNVPPELQDQFPDIPWRNMVGTRNVIAHEYEKLTHIRVHEIANDYAVPLLPLIERALQQLSEQE